MRQANLTNGKIASGNLEDLENMAKLFDEGKTPDNTQCDCEHKECECKDEIEMAFTTVDDLMYVFYNLDIKGEEYPIMENIVKLNHLVSLAEFYKKKRGNLVNRIMVQYEICCIRVTSYRSFDDIACAVAMKEIRRGFISPEKFEATIDDLKDEFHRVQKLQRSAVMENPEIFYAMEEIMKDTSTFLELTPP